MIRHRFPGTPDFDDDLPSLWGECPDLTVDVEDNPIVGVLLGPDGEPLLELHERRIVPFGFTGR